MGWTNSIHIPKVWMPAWTWAVGNSNRNTTVTDIYFPHQRRGFDTGFYTADGIPFNASMWDSTQPNDIWDQEV